MKIFYKNETGQSLRIMCLGVLISVIAITILSLAYIVGDQLLASVIEKLIVEQGKENGRN